MGLLQNAWNANRDSEFNAVIGRLIRFTLVIGLSLAAGCTSTGGRDVAEARSEAKRIKVGMTRSQVESMLRQPYQHEVQAVLLNYPGKSLLHEEYTFPQGTIQVTYQPKILPTVRSEHDLLFGKGLKAHPSSDDVVAYPATLKK